MDNPNPFAVAVEWGRERLEGLRDDLAEAYRTLSFYQLEHGYESKVEGAQREFDRAEASLAATRDALALFERLAAVEVEIRVQGGEFHSRVFAEARKTTEPTAYAPSLLHVWQPEDHDQVEVEVAAHVAALAECRRRNTLAAERAEADEAEGGVES